MSALSGTPSASAIRNPVLPGFNPDPSLLRVGDDYYIATSTFEWFPGVQIHHSRDLRHWRLLTRPLDRLSLLDMRGNPCSGGIWAPCLSHDGELFHLIYTDVKHLLGAGKDMHNYLTTAPAIEGPWSEPVYLNGSGFDPSLFHDSAPGPDSSAAGGRGRKWLLNMLWDHRPGRNRFAGILLQEYSPREKKLVGAARNIFPGSPLGITEGPHLYKRDGWYYLLTAEGGTSWTHAVTLARSRNIEGPYELDPAYPLLTAKDRPDLALQKAGHGSLVETQNGEWYLAHLASRPVGEKRRCILGRETCLQQVEWTQDGWLRLPGGGRDPQVEVPAPALPSHPFQHDPVRDDFNAPLLGLPFQSLRIPIDPSWLSLKDRPGFLRLFGRESLRSRHAQSLVARRLQAFRCRVETRLEFEPAHFQQMAGLVLFYNVDNWYYLAVMGDEGAAGKPAGSALAQGSAKEAAHAAGAAGAESKPAETSGVTGAVPRGKALRILASDNGAESWPAGEGVSVTGAAALYLRAEVDHAALRFFHSQDGAAWEPIGPVLDASILSDDAVKGWGFTGAFAGLCAQDLSGARHPADFDYFDYEER